MRAERTHSSLECSLNLVYNRLGRVDRVKIKGSEKEKKTEYLVWMELSVLSYDLIADWAALAI